MSNSAQNRNTSNTFKYDAEDDLFQENPEQEGTNCQGMNERDFQPQRFPDMDYLETSSDGEAFRVPMNIRQMNGNANAILSNSSTESRVQISETDGNSVAMQPQTVAWDNNSNVNVFYSRSQHCALPPTLGNNSQHISLLSPSFQQSGIANNNHYSKSSSDSSTNLSINVSNTLRMAATDSTVCHNVTLAENGVENSDQSSPELDSQKSFDGLNSQFSTYGASQGDPSSSGRLIASQGEDVNSKSTSPVRRGVKRKLSTSQNVQGGQTEVADEDGKREELKKKNREYAQQSRKRKNEKMESLEQENNKKDAIIEIYTKMLTIYHKDIYGEEPSWIKQKKTWHSSKPGSHDIPQEIEIKLPILGDDFYRKLGNAVCGEIIHDTSTKSIKVEEISESPDQDRQISTENAYSSQNLPTYYEDNDDTHEDVEYIKTTNSHTERVSQVNHFPITSCSLQRAQNTASASYVHRAEYKPVQMVNNALGTIMKNGNPSVNNNLKMKSATRLNATPSKTASVQTPELSQTKITQYTGSCKPSDSGLPTSPKSRFYVQISPHAAPKLNHNGANIALCNVSSPARVSLINSQKANVPNYISSPVHTILALNSVVAGQPVTVAQHGSTLSAAQCSSTFSVSRNTEKSHATVGNNSQNFQNLEEATSDVMTISVAEAEVVRDRVGSHREQEVGYQTLRHATDENDVEDLEPSIEIC